MELYKYLEELYLNNTPITLKSLVNTIYNLENLVFFDTSNYWIKKLNESKASIYSAYKYVVDEMHYIKPAITFIVDNIAITLYLRPYENIDFSIPAIVPYIDMEIYIKEIEKEMLINE